jgi:uncharacterized phage protein (TIGR01671 family)
MNTQIQDIIKFRCWDTTKQEWIYFSIEGISPHITFQPDSFGQYIGKKDKNGKEIYEQDIVKYAVKRRICPTCAAKEITSEQTLKHSIGTFCPSCGTKTSYDDFVTTAIVVRDRAAFGYKHDVKKETYQFWTVYANEIYIEWVEVIGNIFETPDWITK